MKAGETGDPLAGGRAAGRTAWLQALVLAAAVFAVYGIGACSTIYVGDSGELVTAVHGLGIPHPSGYPLYVLLGKAWTLLLPLGSIAYRMSLFSAAFAAAACGLLHRLCRRMGLHPAAGATAALLLAFSPSVWAEANIQRVYALNLFFVVLATSLAWRWLERRSAGALALAFLACGMGASNHTFMAVYAVALAIFAMASEPGLVRRRPVRFAGAVAAFLPGLLVYLYLLLRSRADPRLDWGNPETLAALLRVVTRSGFWARRWIEGPADLIPIAGDYLRSLAIELGWVGAALALLGAFFWWRSAPLAAKGSGETGTSSLRDDPAGGTPPSMPAPTGGAGPSRAAGRSRLWVLLPLLVMAGNAAALALHGSRTDIFIWHRYYIPSYAMAALLAGIGVHALVCRLPRPLRWAPLLLPLVLLSAGWRDHDRSRYRIGEDFSLAVLDILPPGAHLIAEDDNILFTLMYLHLVEGRRPDIDLILQGVGGESLPPLRFDPDVDALYFTHHPNWTLPELEIVPMGVAFRAWRAGRPAPQPVIPRLALDGERDNRVPKDYLTRNLIGHFHYMLGVTFEAADWPRARREFAAAQEASPENDVLFFNVGLIYARNGLFDDAIAAFERSHRINPRHIANRRRPRADDKIRDLKAERQRIEALVTEIALSDSALAAATPDSAAYLRRLAGQLELRGEGVAARGHRLRALEIETAAHPSRRLAQ